MTKEAKRVLRKAAVDRRAAAHGTVDAGPACAALKGLIDATDGPVSFYWPIRTEIDPRPVMEACVAEGRLVALPVTHGRAALSFRAWAPGAAMIKDGFQVDIPQDDVAVEPQVLIVPMLAFDRACHRLGYGAGHYDRTLDALRRTGPRVAIGFAYAAQEAAGPLPVEPTDQPLDDIVTETGIIRP